jgi:hypothetical protein
VAESLSDFLAQEHQYLREREGSEFFLALPRYVETLNNKRRIRRAISALKKDVESALRRYADDLTGYVAEVRSIRNDLALRAPEIDNSNMEQPEVRSHDYTKWDLDSFARFDQLVQRDATLQIGYPTVPSDRDDPGVVTQLLQILRGRLRAAEYGEDASSFADRVRHDLGDLGIRIGNVSRRHEHGRRRFRQESRTLPGLAIGRLFYFGADLNPEPTLIETDEDVERWLDKTLREWGKPKTAVRKLVNGDQMDEWERNSARDTEQLLKGELDRLHQELARRLSVGRGPTLEQLRREPLIVGIITGVAGTVIATLILFYGFGIGD